MSKNDITGDTLATKHLSGDAKKAYDESYDRTFGNKNKAREATVWVLGEDATQIDMTDFSDIKPQCCGDGC